MSKGIGNIYLDILKPRFSFDQIAGYENVKEKMYEMIVVPLKYAEQLKKSKIKPPTGVVVWGPLGSGKGHMIECAAREAEASYVIIRGRECTDNPMAIKKGFELAMENRPCVIHVMDIDWLCPRKDADYTWSDGTTYGTPDKFGSEEVRQTVYKEISRVAQVENVMPVGSCYRIDVLDQAFTRTTMLGRKIYVPRPSKRDRKEIFKYHLRNAKLDSDVDLEKMAGLTKYYVGWDIEAICRKATLMVIERGESFVRMEDLLKAKEKISAWLSPEMASDYDRIMASDCIHKYNF
jgi:transitional endoplasmic reticulum ATPase